MLIKQLPVGQMANYCYMICKPETALCVLIDPSWDMDKIEKEVAKENSKIAFVILTHGHYDHSKYLDTLTEKLNVPVYIEESDVCMLEMSKKSIKTFSKNTILKEKGFEFQIIHTPGHSPGSCCILIEDNLFTGDTLFINACGRVDLPGSNSEDMRQSLLKLAKLEPGIIVYPGHSYSQKNSSTIGEESKNNPVIALARKGKEYF
jgi:glyoxylase-like metal-dependent hydrolase (beta-lactamase superfamily II)